MNCMAELICTTVWIQTPIMRLANFLKLFSYIMRPWKKPPQDFLDGMWEFMGVISHPLFFPSTPIVGSPSIQKSLQKFPQCGWLSDNNCGNFLWGCDYKEGSSAEETSMVATINLCLTVDRQDIPHLVFFLIHKVVRIGAWHISIL